MGSAKTEVQQGAAEKKKQQIQNISAILIAILVVLFAIYAPPEYGVFVFVAILGVAGLMKYKKAKKKA